MSVHLMIDMTHAMAGVNKDETDHLKITTAFYSWETFIDFMVFLGIFLLMVYCLIIFFMVCSFVHG